MGAIVHCFGVVDEADIISDFLEYHLWLGVDVFVAVDLGSTDGTLDILRRYARSGRLHLTEYQDHTAEEERRGWWTAMVNAAKRSYGAEWCFFCDVDEFLVIPGGDVRAYLAAAPSPIIIFSRFNVVPRRESGSDRIADFRTFDLIVRRPLEFLYDLKLCDTQAGVAQLATGYPPDILRFLASKVAARADTIASLIDGHDVVPVDSGTPRHHEQVGYIAHFQTRSLAQWRKKARLVAGYVKVNASKFSFGRTWIRLAALHRHGLIDRDFAREVLGDDEIALRMRQGVIERDARLAQRLAELTRQPGEAELTARIACGFRPAPVSLVPIALENRFETR